MSLTFIFSAMKGGKSTLLLQAAHAYRSRGFTVLLVRPEVNNREDNISSRMGISSMADLNVSEATLLGSLLEKTVASLATPVAAVLVDEAQFLTPPQVEDLALFSLNNSVEVQAYGLKTSFTLELFPGSKRLLELADHLIELDGVLCACGAKAKVNARFDAPSGKLITEGPAVFIEGASAQVVYDPLCLKCFVSLGGSLKTA